MDWQNVLPIHIYLKAPKSKKRDYSSGKGISGISLYTREKKADASPISKAINS
jgi:hypothetical protein